MVVTVSPLTIGWSPVGWSQVAGHSFASNITYLLIYQPVH